MDCRWGSWSHWSCSLDKYKCGETGKTTRTRKIAQKVSGDGKDCEGPAEESGETCNNGECTGKF